MLSRSSVECSRAASRDRQDGCHSTSEKARVSKHCRWRDKGWRECSERERKWKEKGVFNFQGALPTSVRKCRQGYAQWNFYCISHTLLSFAMHFKSLVWIFLFQADAGLFPERKKRERGKKMSSCALVWAENSPPSKSLFVWKEKKRSGFINFK